MPKCDKCGIDKDEYFNVLMDLDNERHKSKFRLIINGIVKITVTIAIIIAAMIGLNLYQEIRITKTIELLSIEYEL